MHFKTCRKASSSDDCERITGKLEVISSHDGLVPTNELVLIEPINSRMVISEAPQKRGWRKLAGLVPGSRLVGSDRDCSRLTGHPEVETGRRWPRPEDLLIGLGLKTKASVSS